jgi:hypothetical protein
MTEADIQAMSDEALEKAAQNLKRNAAMQAAGDLADLRVARDERPSDAVDRVLDRNFERSQRIATLQQWVRAEQERRAGEKE